MKLGRLLMRFCRGSQTVAVGLRVTTATLAIVALLSPANAVSKRARLPAARIGR